MLELITILTGSIGLAVILYLTGYIIEMGSKLKIAGTSHWNPIDTKPFLQRLDYMTIGLLIIGTILVFTGPTMIVLSIVNVVTKWTNLT
ncbi:MAG: hypothetical protein DRN71_05140 [Candidatus Nanohalarchaeota archaeon]|nr:MAG: hypothetical protein DRN71_05140 [Candidatus Nanohaloarchaeota archaeon]